MRCEMSDLPQEMCAHCRGHDGKDIPGPDAADPVFPDEVTGPVITSRYNSKCAVCHDWVKRGEPIVPTTHGYAHETCV